MPYPEPQSTSTARLPAATTSCGEPSAAVALFRSLGDPARLAILKRLAEGEARVTDLVGCVGLAQSTVSAHLSCLRDCGHARSCWACWPPQSSCSRRPARPSTCAPPTAPTLSPPRSPPDEQHADHGNP